ncbi:MAG: TetR/AcrR family transcriptional regulator [Acidobacteriota bacterium]|nr:TetR/AcrR family transcriptional regulator [Acidobacteriota bacterium]
MSSRASVRQTKKSEKKQRIQEAAIHVLAKNGYHGTTVSQIARAAGVADGTLYLYFDNKDDLLLKIIDELTAQFIEEGKDILEQYESPMDRLRKFAELHLKNLGADEDLACIFQIELRHNLRFMKMFSQTRMRTYFSILEGIIHEACEAGEVREDVDARLTAILLFGSLDELVTNWLLSERDYALVEMAGPMLDILLNGIAKKTN